MSMRQVSRKSVGVPPRLRSVTPHDLDQIRAGNKPRTDIYRHADVVYRLRALYLGKCYLCEAAVSDSAPVEHFLSWHRKYAGRAYNWHNLHWCCDSCNKRKKNKPYCERSVERNPPVLRVFLIDPSCPPCKCKVDEVLSFQRDLKAVAIGPHAHEKEVARTAEFLNDRPWVERLIRFEQLIQLACDAECKSVWVELSRMAAIEPEKGLNHSKRTKRLSALERADALFTMFLLETSPYYTAVRQALPLTMRLTVEDFARMHTSHRSYSSRGVPVSSAAPSAPG